MQKINVHKNHRKRIRERYEKNGADAFELHQLMEMLLFHSLRQGDTNPIAHKILDAHPDVAFGITDSYELTDVEGVGKNTANLLRISTDTVLTVLTEGLKKAPMDGEFTRKQFMWLWFRTRPEKRVAVLLLDSKNRFLECKALNISDSRLPRSYERSIVCALKKHGAVSAVLCHNHRNCEKSPSIEDIYLTAYLKNALEKKGFSLMAHYIVTGNDCVECPLSENEQ